MDPASTFDALNSGNATTILAAIIVALMAALVATVRFYFKEKDAHDKTRADHAQMQREDLTNILNTTNQVTEAMKSVERAVFGRGAGDV